MCYRGTVIRKLWELNSSNADKIRVQFVACSLNVRKHGLLDYVFIWLQFGEVCSKNQWKSLVNHAVGYFENSCREVLLQCISK